MITPIRTWRQDALLWISVLLALAFASLIIKELTAPSTDARRRNNPDFHTKKVAQVETPEKEVSTVIEIEAKQSNPTDVNGNQPTSASTSSTIPVINTNPSGANVFIDDRQRGRTPLYNVSVDKGRPHKIRFQKVGYKTEWDIIIVGQTKFDDVALSPE